MKYPTSQKLEEIAYRRKLVSGLRLRGLTHLQIKEQLEKQGISVDRSTVTNDIKALKKDWEKDAQSSTEEHINEMHAKLRQTEVEAWDMYQKAKKEGKAGGTNAGYWHKEILETLDRESKLLGLNKEDKKSLVTVNNYSTMKAEDLTDDQLVMIINGKQAGSSSGTLKPQESQN